MTPVSYFVQHEATSPNFAFAFARGCDGTITADLDYLFPGPVAAFGSPPVWPLLKRAQASGRDVYYGDHGYIGRRRAFRITKNAYQHDGTGPGSPERFAALDRPIQPWTKSGGHILVCPNSDIYFGLHDINADRWRSDVLATLRAHTDREIRVRWKYQSQTRPIRHDLEGCWAVVVYSSASAIDALIAGVPVFSLAPFASTRRMGLDDLSRIESPHYPDDREAFLHAISSQQWSMQEIFSGVAWRALQEQDDRAA